MGNYYYIFLSFKVVRSNLCYSSILSNVRFKISLGQLFIILSYKTSKKINTEELHKLETKIIYKFLGIGLIIDIITTITNIIISTDYKGLIFSPNNKIICSFHNPETSFEQFHQQLKSLKVETEIGASSNFYPIIKKSEIKFKEKSILLNLYLLSKVFNSDKLNNSAISLFNYWRKAFILFKLGCREESFLNYYKILEYFLTKNKPDEAVGNLIKKFSLSNQKIAKRLLESFIEIRNHWDIAHKRIKRLQKDRYAIPRDEFFNISFYDHLWEKHDDIKEISRFLIYKYLGIEKIQLIIDKTNALTIELINDD